MLLDNTTCGDDDDDILELLDSLNNKSSSDEQSQKSTFIESDDRTNLNVSQSGTILGLYYFYCMLSLL